MAPENSKLGLDLKYQVEKPPQQIVLDLEQIEATDKQYSQARNKYQTLLTISSISIFISLFLLAIPPLGIPVLIIAVAATFYFYHHYKRFARLKIEPYRYLLVKKLTELLRRDLPEAGHLKIDLDFTKPMIAHKLISEGNHPLRPGWKLKVYRDPWLNIQGQFCDRTNFELSILENHQNVSGWKRGRRGKRKYKSKNKFKGSEIYLQLRYPSKKYGAIQVLKNDAIEAIKLPQFCELKNFRLTDKSIQIKAKISQMPSMPTIVHHQLENTYQVMVSMLLSGYQILNLARTLSKSSN